MRALNRAKLLWGYLRRQTKPAGLPVEYIVETTAKCNLYCPMCPRETHRQPKEDMTDEIFTRLVRESGESAEHMMLIGLGEPLLDPKIFDRIEYCATHNISTLLSTNGTLLDEASARGWTCRGDRRLRKVLHDDSASGSCRRESGAARKDG
jgi:sulfatase maturation enzyme AslB (radical SAM superfamily)